MTLKARDLAVGRGGIPVLAELSFTVEPGRALILRGPNGAGKTTLLRTIAGLQGAYAGSVTPGPDAVAYAGHRDGMKGTLTVEENLSFWAGLHGQSGINDALAAFDLERLEDRLAQHLSAGQARRLGLARLVVTGRSIWCLDEPTVSLDTVNTGRFADLVRAHLGQGGIAVIATHIDLGLEGDVLDVTPYRATASAMDLFA
ncbi:Cytochrome c biogenesis ATP-binding export protein CcmA [Rhodobacteraceae bacterium THAF1]|uniref:heme ABC exporter ATP-binding protein CcmA n=1 Tax=Palleronia sp. THAF1 TaxID=2587842 RepID=UPI000F4194A6|nr:heme ABC exporter ATP-binding protein CcmA [Palleronia sp. THAF1]QFU09006.1 Cytochrome c biogenesis ATP-binding export protein CcmA [Palleronia sp. THAF1]VDC24253.1 Cytochrome c biogenesis ATP-binding export protein CcmA [Rhodobacteraceae bacterium THAF1]